VISLAKNNKCIQRCDPPTSSSRIRALGSEGPPGPPGPPGGLLGFAYIYNTAAQPIPNNDDVNFSDTGPLTGTVFSHTAGSSNISINEPGIYLATYLASGNQNIFGVGSLYFNGTDILGSSYNTTGFGGYLGQVIFTVGSPGILTVRNTSGGQWNLFNYLGVNGEIGTNFSISLLKLA